MISFSYSIQDLANGVTLAYREPRSLVGEHYKVPKSQNWSRNWLPLPDESRNRGRIVCCDWSIENNRGRVGERFTTVDERVKTSPLRVDLPNPRLRSASKNWLEQIAINNRECFIPQSLFELLAPTAELGYILDDS
jgi:hypothetical protein